MISKEAREKIKQVGDRFEGKILHYQDESSDTVEDLMDDVLRIIQEDEKDQMVKEAAAKSGRVNRKSVDQFERAKHARTALASVIGYVLDLQERVEKIEAVLSTPIGEWADNGGKNE